MWLIRFLPREVQKRPPETVETRKLHSKQEVYKANISGLMISNCWIQVNDIKFTIVWYHLRMSKKGLAIWEILVGIRRRDGRMVSMCQNIRFNTFSILSCLLSDDVWCLSFQKCPHGENCQAAHRDTPSQAFGNEKVTIVWKWETALEKHGKLLWKLLRISPSVNPSTKPSRSLGCPAVPGNNSTQQPADSPPWTKHLRHWTCPALKRDTLRHRDTLPSDPRDTMEKGQDPTVSPEIPIQKPFELTTSEILEFNDLRTNQKTMTSLHRWDRKQVF